MANNQRPISQILQSGASDLRRLVERSHHWRRLDRRLRALLPAPLASHCRLAGLRQRTLVLLVDSPAWATRARLSVPLLLRRLRAEGVDEIELRIAPPPTERRRGAGRRALPVSEENANLLIELAKNTTDPALGAALSRLARHARARERKS